MNIENQNQLLHEENVIAGIFGAFLFSLVGGIAWFVFYLLGFFSSISGVIAAVLAIKGYALFAKKQSIKGIVISSIIAFLSLVIAWYLCIAKDIYDAYQTWFKNGEVDFTLSYFESLRAVPIFLTDSEIGRSYIYDLAIGLLFAAIGAYTSIKYSVKEMKNKNINPSTDFQNVSDVSQQNEQDAAATSVQPAQTDEQF